MSDASRPPGAANLADAARVAASAGAPSAGGPAGSPEGAPGHVAPGEEYVRLADFEQVARERDEHKADMQRLAADFENFRRRAARDRDHAAAAADAKLLGELLQVIDDLERALEHAEQVTADDPHAPLADGIRMVHSRLDSVLRNHGLEQVDVAGQFDPHLHEAMVMQPGEGRAEGDILQVFQHGWKLGDRVLRHAKVVVASGD